ncbi:hypothetical protein FWP33_09060 [Vibrio parahaemolyticus]|jgi:hypothetical protein|uniref:DUF7146 domain-containing protein n=1 Tax=Vibrio jasicida TaxID=766224 RepID=A0AAU9QTH7_9VIBR|nr:hypothetical protein [Vibrio parahaemolyticus]ELA8176660.1 hypothetical protein [Vibrio alginolyticus]CAH1598641.1 conserved hypothetical protein [Vibrio jasicida]EJC7176090.1 hypothetical protein [Vibrio parahaemolyticus]EJG0009823.1 hypothetical protein [Vibrio parahaemolyticus]
MYHTYNQSGYENTPIPDENDVFKLVSRIPDFTSVYTHWGLGDYIKKAPTAGKPCPKNPGKKTSTKFRFRKGWEQSGRWHHNDIDSGASQGPIEFAKWYFGIGDDIDAAMEVLNAAGIEFTDLRGTGYQPQTTLNPITQTPLTDEQIAARKVEEYEEAKQKVISIAKAWQGGLEISHPVARDLLDKHLQIRGFPAGHVDRMPRHIRVNMNLCYHQSFRSENKNAFYAGWIIPVAGPDGKRITIHRHFMQKDTGAIVPEEKRKLMMGSPWDLPPGSHLEYDKPLVFNLENGDKAVQYNLGEGAETMEAVRIIMDEPVQPMISTGLLQNFIPKPEDIEGIKPENVLIDFWIDKDSPDPNDSLGRGPGEIAADRAIERLSNLGYNCAKNVPPLEIPAGKKGVDWLNAYLQYPLEELRQSLVN